MSASKAYIFGKTSAGDAELGETYHVALALAAVAGAEVFIKDLPLGEEFLTLLGFSERITSNKPSNANKLHLPETPSKFKTHWVKVEKARCDFWKIISEKAKAENWEKELLGHKIKLPETEGNSALLWLRNSDYKRERNLTKEGLHQLLETCKEQQITPITVGPLPDDESWSRKFDDIQQLGPFYAHSFFQTDSIARQLWFLNYLHEKCNIVANIGMMSGAMDGLAFFARKRVIFFESGKADTRMAKNSKLFESFERIKIRKNITKTSPFQSFTDLDLAKLKEKLLLPELA